MSLRVVQVSDTHLSPDAPYSDAHWDAVLAHVEATRPDLVVHTGDVSANGSEGADDLVHARRRLDELTVRWLAIPGNHDIGDTAPTTSPVDDTRRRRYADSFGATRWSIDEGGWRLVGVDAQTMLSDLADAADEWAWLADALDTELPTALFLHRPLQPFRDDTVDDPRRYVMPPGRQRLAALLGASAVRLVGTGHVHQWWSGRLDGVAHVWAPSAWAVLPDDIQPVIGAKHAGIVEHELAPDGACTSTFVRPAGLADVTIGADFPSPYAE